MPDRRKALAGNKVSDKGGAVDATGQDGSLQNQSVLIFKSAQGPETTDSSMCNPLNSICTAKPAGSIHTLMSRLCAK